MRWWLSSIVLITGLAGWIYFARRPTAPIAASYIDPVTCAGCHPAIAETYQRTGMGRSFSRPTSANTAAEAAYYHKPSESYFSMEERDGRFYQGRYESGFGGQETNVVGTHSV